MIARSIQSAFFLLNGGEITGRSGSIGALGSADRERRGGLRGVGAQRVGVALRVEE
jgi:hypothetical protein